MDPATLAALGGVNVASGLMQYYQAEKARKASEARLRQIEEMFNQIVPPDYNINVFDDPRVAADIPLPALNLDALTPEMYQRVGQYVPEVAQYVQAAQPELAKVTDEAAKGRQAQMAALEQYRKIAGGQVPDVELEQTLREAGQKSQAQAQSRQGSLAQDFARRGQLGSTAQLAMQMGAGEQAASQAGLESQRAAVEAYKNRLGALNQSAQLGGNIRESEMGEQSRNAAVMNDFNQRTSKQYQDYLQNVANLQNEAQRYNLGQSQQIASQNVDVRNKAAQEAVNRYNVGQTDLYKGAQQNRNNILDLIRSKQGMAQQGFSNTMDIAKSKAGIGTQGIDYMYKNTAGRNQAIQGMGEGITSTGMAYGNYQNQANNRRDYREAHGLDPES